MRDMIHARHRMVDVQIARRGIDDPGVLEAMRTVPREKFVAPGSEDYAYEDGPLPIGHGQTISQPFIVALMIDKARLEHERQGSRGRHRIRLCGCRDEQDRRPMSTPSSGIRRWGARRASRFTELGYGNIVVRIGDGTKGWPEHAPFDAILVAAGGPFAPQALKDQLAIGGRLIIPVGRDFDQRLVRITRRSTATFDEEDLGGVVFVPLIGEQGWREDGSAPVASDEHPPALARMIADAAEPLPDIDEPGFARLFDRFADRRVVLLGEATHGTSEFYRARAAITRRLIEAHGFTIVAVEADWPDAASIDRHVRLRPDDAGADPPFRRFPTWMWRNVEVSAFLDGMRRHNESLGDPDRQAGFYGLDIYNMSASIAAVLAYLGEVDPEAAAVARERYGCLTPWQHEPSDYGRAVLASGYQKCEAAVIEQCRDLLRRSLEARRRRGIARRGPECPAGGVGGALLSHHVPRRRRGLELARHPHVRDAGASARSQGPAVEGGGLGAQFPYRRRAPHRYGPAARRTEPRPALPPALRCRGRADRLRHAQGHRGRGQRLGRRDGDQGRAALPSREP